MSRSDRIHREISPVPNHETSLITLCKISADSFSFVLSSRTIASQKRFKGTPEMFVLLHTENSLSPCFQMIKTCTLLLSTCKCSPNIFDEVKPIFSGLLSSFSCYDDYQCVRGGCIFSCCELHGLRELDSLTYVEGFTFCFVPKVSFLPLCFTSESTAEPS